MGRCVIKSCPNSHRHSRGAGQKYSYFTFPKNKETAQKWMEIIGIEKMPNTWVRVCSAHFRPEAYKPKTWVQQQLDYLPTRFRRLREDAIPTENLTPVDIYRSGVFRSNSVKKIQKNMKQLEDRKEESVPKIDLVSDELSEPETSDARIQSEQVDEEVFPEPSIETDVEIDHEDLVVKYIKEKKKVVLWKTLCQIYKERAEFAEKQLQEIMDLNKR